MYVYIVYVRIYIYVPIVGGFGGPLRDKFWADFGAKKLGQKNRDHSEFTPYQTTLLPLAGETSSYLSVFRWALFVHIALMLSCSIDFWTLLSPD